MVFQLWDVQMTLPSYSQGHQPSAFGTQWLWPHRAQDHPSPSIETEYKPHGITGQEVFKTKIRG